VLTYSAEERILSVQILALLVNGVNTTGIFVVGNYVLRRLGQQTVLVFAVSHIQLKVYLTTSVVISDIRVVVM